MRIHNDHYDWWMFPIDRKSSMGYDFTVYSGATSYLPPSFLLPTSFFLFLFPFSSFSFLPPFFHSFFMHLRKTVSSNDMRFLHNIIITALFLFPLFSSQDESHFHSRGYRRSQEGFHLHDLVCARHRALALGVGMATA